MNKFQATLIAAASGVVALGLTGVACAAETDASPPSFVVRYSADTFASEASTKAFYHTLVRAAQRVCVDQPSVGPFLSDATRACRKQALEGALAHIKNTRLAEIASQTRNG